VLSFAACAGIVWILCERAPIIEDYEEDELERLNRIFLSATHHREHLDACYQELCDIHHFEPDSFGYDEMIDVVYAGASYDEALLRSGRYEQRVKEE
jgi:hypothetical protein